MQKENTTQSGGRRRPILIVLAASLLVAIGVVAFWPGPKEPEYDGKTLSEWLDLCRNYRLGNESQSQSAQIAQEAVRKIGTNGLPLLVNWMNYDMPKWKSDLLASKQSRWLP